MRTLDFWTERLKRYKEGLLTQEFQLAKRRKKIVGYEKSIMVLKRGSKRRRFRVYWSRLRKHASENERRIERLQKKIAFYEARIQARQARTVWDILKRPEL